MSKVLGYTFKLLHTYPFVMIAVNFNTGLSEKLIPFCFSVFLEQYVPKNFKL